MTMSFDNTNTVLAEARTNAMMTRYDHTSPSDPDAAVRASIQALEPVAPSAGVAAVLLSTASVHPVPLHREALKPTGDPLSTLAAVEGHYRTHATDGVGVRAGAQANRSTVFAVRGTLAALRAFLADVGAETREVVNEFGTVSLDRSYRPTTPFVQVSWAAPPPPPAQTITWFGAGLLAAHKHLHTDRGEQERALAATAWLAWTVAPRQDRRLVVRSRKLAKGVEVLGEGDVIPWHARRANGWTCAGANMPIASDTPLSPWLADAVGATWKVVR